MGAILWMLPSVRAALRTNADQVLAGSLVKVQQSLSSGGVLLG
jgi:hypothetical protein